MKFLETVIDCNDNHNTPLSNEKLRPVISRVMAETGEEELEAKHNAKNVTMDTFCQSPVTTNTQENIANVPTERQISLNILAETIKVFKVLTLDSTINVSAYYHSEEYDASIDPNSDPKVATHTSDEIKQSH